MAGIYIHIPFCRSRCVYCGFYSTTSLELRQRYVDAVCREMELRGERIESSEERISTIYLGGGTPSQLTIEQLRQLFIYINKVYPLTSNTEITIEVNPDDVTAEYAALLQQFPINRISMGIQTFDDQRLRFLHRRHTATQAIEAVDRLRAAGFQNISIDLMYGFPGETLADWEADIEAALALNVEHLSAYCLMIEEGTPLYRMLRQHKGDCPQCVDEETERSMYYTLIDRLAAADYEHYEISNFARPDFRSRHNSSYWNGTPYIGLGAAAHSYDGRSRSWNVADITAYIEGIEQGKRLFEEELLDDDTRYNDTITVTLRTKEGLDLSLLSDKHKDYCMKNARRYLDDGLLELTSHLRLTRRGLFVSDMVMSDLMMV
ncbi:MAG: radical SAM family heme chaperone HemW [Prevotella sp.]|nr:radical SAM family heme chaperone HemW [Prevotella sp.]